MRLPQSLTGRILLQWMPLGAALVTWGGAPPQASGQRLVVQPQRVQMDDLRQQQRLAVVVRGPQGGHADVTRQARFQSGDPRIVSVDASGVLRPRGSGKTAVTVTWREQSAAVPVEVAGGAKPTPIRFRTEVIAALSRGGCNQGACHGSPQGKNRFRLSLRGFDPDLDLQTLTREEYGRRVNPFAADRSLILLKASGGVAHQGGLRFARSDPALGVLRQWIAEGAADRPAPRLERLEVLPTGGLLQSGHPRQQLIVRAHFDNGQVRDVTDLSVFTLSDDSADVKLTERGELTFHGTGETAVLVRYLDQIESLRLTYVARDPAFRFVSPEPANYVDRHVFAKQRSLQLNPHGLADDAEFLRRVYLDLLGAIPTPAEAQQFLDSQAPDKRRELIDRLLEREEFALFWAMKWADVMRGNREAITQRGVHNLHRYLVRSFAADRGFDRVARELLTSLGNSIHTPAANFYRISRTPNQTAEAFSQLFLGVRIQCAKCHNHPYESISQRDYYGLASHFARVRLKGKRFGLDDEVVYLTTVGEVTMPGESQPLKPTAFGMPTENLAAGDDRRFDLAAWLTSGDNRYFARSTVNRVWAHVMGLGIVEPVDDFRDSNPPSNPALLDALAKEFVESGYRFKPVLRSILNSRTYQLSSARSVKQSSRAAPPKRYFTRPIIKLLSAEQIIDAISTATDVPERFPGYPRGAKAISLAEGAVDHKFLQAFTRPVRDVACDCARETEPGLNQALHLLNNPSILKKIDAPKSRLGRWLKAGKRPDEIVELIYLATLSRRPREKERAVARAHLDASRKPADGLRDLQHALLNSNEFLLRH